MAHLGEIQLFCSIVHLHFQLFVSRPEDDASLIGIVDSRGTIGYNTGAIPPLERHSAALTMLSSSAVIVVKTIEEELSEPRVLYPWKDPVIAILDRNAFGQE